VESRGSNGVRWGPLRSERKPFHLRGYANVLLVLSPPKYLIAGSNPAGATTDPLARAASRSLASFAPFDPDGLLYYQPMVLGSPRAGGWTLIVILVGSLLWGGCGRESADARICRAFERLGGQGAKPSEAAAIQAMHEIQTAGKSSDERIARVARGATRVGNQIGLRGGSLDELRSACHDRGVTLPIQTGTG
jgi:hypothetical protein